MEKKRYEESVRERMQKKFPEELMGGTFRGRSYPHIFKDLKHNFIDGIFPIKKSLKGNLSDAEIKYHYAEHLNSSQAMCIGYFKKFFETKKYEPLLAKVLVMQGIDVSDGEKFTDAVFEYIPYPKEGTNFDFYLKLASGKQITWEIKFAESEFGGTTKQANAASRYIDKYENIYIPMFEECVYDQFPKVSCDNYQCLETGKLTDNCCKQEECSIYTFYKHYQIRRNILYAREKGDYVIFLTPRENVALNEGREYIEQYAEKWETNHIRNIYWEDLLETTLHVVSCEPELFDYYSRFKEKYFE